ncbi:MAG: ABC transporter substrate-binding protein [Spirochaetaceae bacterium]|nr:ABC transporter substrate-binding protein [Spirochaetaceae bacterium]
MKKNTAASKRFAPRMAVHILFLGAFLAGAAAHAETEFTVYAIKGPSGVALVELFEKPLAVPGFTIKMDLLADSGQMAARMISGEIKAGILPPNIAAKIAASGKPLQIAAVTGNGMLSLLSAAPGIQSVKDLKGITVFVAGQGAVPEYVFRKVLEKNGLQPDKDVKLDFSLAYPEIAQSLIAKRIQAAVLPEPFSTMAMQSNAAIRRISALETEWGRISGQPNYPMTVLAVNAEFARQNPALIKALLGRVKESIAWVTAHPEQAGILSEKYGLGITKTAAASSVPRSNFVYQDAMQAKPALEALFKAFLDFAPSSIGGKMPDGSFYYKAP